MTHASDSPKEIHEFAKDAISAGAFKMARIFKERMFEIMHDTDDPAEIEAIASMIADISSRME